MRYPLAVAKEAKRQVDIANQQYPQLYTTLPPADASARAFAENLGFVIIPGLFVCGLPLAQRIAVDAEAA